ncbi:MAG: hypothetical protein HYR64_05015 [Fimbriimonas ginsengisoli]|uniref:Uncharacterized protein n=1 Tax=Fimbriimonas ginsengisoli TaxID=1005039 RepID=A0A931LS96_FIMGI|nr:hypothetical protein [Fimbriimonas ginsengisoli]
MEFLRMHLDRLESLAYILAAFFALSLVGYMIAVVGKTAARARQASGSWSSATVRLVRAGIILFTLGYAWSEPPHVALGSSAAAAWAGGLILAVAIFVVTLYALKGAWPLFGAWWLMFSLVVVGLIRSLAAPMISVPDTRDLQLVGIWVPSDSGRRANLMRSDKAAEILDSSALSLAGDGSSEFGFVTKDQRFQPFERGRWGTRGSVLFVRSIFTDYVNFDKRYYVLLDPDTVVLDQSVDFGKESTTYRRWSAASVAPTK